MYYYPFPPPNNNDYWGSDSCVSHHTPHQFSFESPPLVLDMADNLGLSIFYMPILKVIKNDQVTFGGYPNSLFGRSWYE